MYFTGLAGVIRAHGAKRANPTYEGGGGGSGIARPAQMHVEGVSGDGKIEISHETEGFSARNS